MSADIRFFIILFVLAFVIYYCDKKYAMLRDTSTATPKPFSFARVQMAWWTVIVLSAFISILWVRHQIPTMLESTLILLGISTATTAAGKIIDVSDQLNPNITRQQDASPSASFFLDILSDEKGVSIHRFQTVAFNMVFGFWFIAMVLKNINQTTVNVDMIIPDITQANLALLGLSSAAYAVLKTTENKSSQNGSSSDSGNGNDEGASDNVVDEGTGTQDQAQG